MRLFHVLALIMSFLSIYTAKESDDVALIKTEKEFNELIKTENVLVKFFAPWCGHCKALAPEYIKAAAELKKESKTSRLVDVDCTSDKTKKVCTKYGVSGYPTLKYFTTTNKNPLDYSGARKTAGIVAFVKKMNQDSVTKIASQEQLDTLLKDTKMVVIEYAESPSKKFQSIADKLRLSYSFAHISDEVLLKAHKMEKNKIALFRSFDEPKLIFADRMRKLSDWIDNHSFPILGEMDGENYRKYFEKNKPIFWIAVNKTNAEQMEKIRSLVTAFKPLRETMLAIFIDGPSFKDALKSMGFSEVYPNAMLINKEEKFQFKGEFNAESVTSFAERFSKGELKRFFKSDTPPKNNTGPILDVVGETFKEIVMDEGKDVLLEYYLTYCGHCKKFEPEYLKLGELFKDEEKLVIAKLNGEKNDTPHKVEGYPTVMLFRAGLKDQPLRYEGERTAEAVEKWLLNNSPMLRKTKGEKVETTEKEEKDKKEL